MTDRLSSARALWILAILTIAFGIAQQPALGRMSDRGTDVIAMECVATTDKAETMLSDWGERGKDAARQQLLLDYPFLIAYGLFLFGACTAVARRAERTGREGLARAGRALAVAGLAGAGFDALENACLL